MPISAIGAGVSAVGQVAGLVSGGGSGSSGVTPMFNTTSGNVPNPNYTRPLGNSDVGKDQSPMSSPKATEAKVTTAQEVSAARDSKSTVSPEFDQVWGNRLSHYIGYNTRQLG